MPFWDYYRFDLCPVAKGKQVQPATSNNNSASFDDEDDYDDGF